MTRNDPEKTTRRAVSPGDPPAIDEERNNVMALLKLLEVRPLCSIANETFVSRFSAVQAATERFISHEETLLDDCPIGAEMKRLHLADHEKIRSILRQIRADVEKKKNQTAIDVYKSLRAEIERHVAVFGRDIGAGTVAAEPNAGREKVGERPGRARGAPA